MKLLKRRFYGSACDITISAIVRFVDHGFRLIGYNDNHLKQS